MTLTVDTHTDFNGSVTTYGYDNMNRLLTRTVNAASGVTANDVSFTYTISGRRQTMTDASGTTVYGYDSRDRLATKATPQGTLIYGYDDASNLTSITTNTMDGASMTYGHDELNRLDSVTDGNAQETTYAYDANGNLSGVGLPNGVISGYQYNAANRLTSLTHVHGSGTIANFAYGLNPTGHRREAVETGQGINLLAPDTERTRVWAYDNLWRLQNESLAAGQANANGSVSYALDSVGNRLSRSSSIPGLATQSFSYNVNDRLVGDTYDANGNTKSHGAQTSPSVGPAGVSPAPVLGSDNYDSSNRLTQRNAPNGDSVQLIYDGDGNKVRQITSRGGITTTTSYLVDDMNPTGYAQVLEERTNDTLTKVYTYGHDLISLDQFTGGDWNLSYYGYDGHGSVRFLTNTLGQVTDTYDYDAFGELLAINGTTPNSFLYCGEMFDADLGLYYLRARLMNPLTGRFWTADSYEGSQGDPATLHKFLYAHANPVSFIDPSGHRIEFDSAKGMMAHALFFRYCAAAGIPKWHDESLKTSLQLSASDPDSRLKPDVVDIPGKRWFELKPISHKYSQKLFEGNDFRDGTGETLADYDRALGKHGISPGNSKQFVPGKQFIGVVWDPSEGFLATYIEAAPESLDIQRGSYNTRGLIFYYFEKLNSRVLEDAVIPIVFAAAGAKTLMLSAQSAAANAAASSVSLAAKGNLMAQKAKLAQLQASSARIGISRY